MHRKLLISLALFALTLALYEPVRRYEFVNFDDPVYVTESPRVLRGLGVENVAWAFRNVHANFWHPLTTLSLMANVEFFGPGPASFHITNVLLHGVNAVLLFLVIRQMTGALWQSAVVAALFAWHPLHVESVAWVSARKDVLSTLFWMLTMMAYARYVNRPKRTSYLLVLVLFTLGLMSKPMLVTLPFVLLLMDYWPLARLKLGQTIPTASTPCPPVSLNFVIMEKVPLLLLSFLFSIAAFLAQGEAVAPLTEIPLWVRVANTPLAYISYIRKTFWPVDLAAFYPYPKEVPLLLIAAASFLLLSVTWVVVRDGRRFPYLPVGWFWFLGTLVPVIGVVQLGLYRTADRFTYIPLIGIFIVVAWGFADAVAGWKQRRVFCVAVTSAALIACIAVSRVQIGYWKDSITLFTHALKVTSDNAAAHTNLAAALAARGQDDESVEHLAAALAISRDDLRLINMGILLLRKDHLQMAIKHFRQALELNSRNALAHENLAVALDRQGNFEGALDHFKIALELKPQSADAHNNFAVALAGRGRIEEAIRHLQIALEIDPDHGKAAANLRELLGVAPRE